MKAVLFKDKKITIIEKTVPSVTDEEVLLRTSMVGICNTDIELFRGYYNFEGIAGHEFVGVVDKATHQPELVGKRVVADINCGCGKCARCLTGDERHCPDRTVIGIRRRDGAFAEYLSVPLRNIHIVDDSIEMVEAVFVEPLAAALEITQQIHIKYKSRIAVLGDGKLGLLAAIALRHYCSQIVLCGKYPEKLQIAADQGVETLHIDPQMGYARILDNLGYFDAVVEATGRHDGIDSAIEITRPEGTIMVKSTSDRRSEIDLAKIVVNELNIIGSRCGNLDLALSFLKNGWIDVKPLIENIYRYKEFHKAFEHACKPGTKKVLVSFE
jgi:threonine dehydrogenase-like Zn-dependent dehydrogenase